jgi:hypothetical protein
MTIDKDALKRKLHSLEEGDLQRAEHAYEQSFGFARVAQGETVEADDLSQAVQSRNLAEQYEAQAHDHREHLAQLDAVSFAATQIVKPGAVVKLGGRDRMLVIAVATAEFECEGRAFLGISSKAPLYKAMEGLEAGESFHLNDREFEIESVW